MQFTRTGSYATSSLPITQTPREGDAEYRISLATEQVTASDPRMVFPASSAQGFTLRAVPVDDDDCGTLLLDQNGRVGVTSPGAKVADCWPKYGFFPLVGVADVAAPAGRPAPAFP